MHKHFKWCRCASLSEKLPEAQKEFLYTSTLNIKKMRKLNLHEQEIEWIKSLSRGTTIAQQCSKNASLFHLRPNKKFTLCLSLYGILMSNLLLVWSTHTESRTHDLYERLFVDAKYADKGQAGGENRPCRSQPEMSRCGAALIVIYCRSSNLCSSISWVYICVLGYNSIYAILHTAFQVKREPRAHFWPKSNWHSATDLLSPPHPAPAVRSPHLQPSVVQYVRRARPSGSPE